MALENSRSTFMGRLFRSAVSVICIASLSVGDTSLIAQPARVQDQEEAANLSNDQLDSLVAPIALYPDPLLAQVLAASTYPLEIIQLQQFLTRNPDMKDKALEDAVMQQDWDPSIQALAALPDVVKRLADDIKWTTDLGNAFLAQQSDVMDAIQRMRTKAKGQGNLKSTEQMTVETKVVESKQVIIIEQANPQVVYVPIYNPVVVYGPPVYRYPAIYYPPPGYYAAGMAISFGVGVAMGAFWSGGWGWGFGWGGSKYNTNITINNNNNFVRNTNINRPSTLPARGGTGGNNWQHNPRHRGGTPYSNRATGEKYGGTTRGSSQAARQESARQQQARQQGGGANRAGPGGAQAAGTRPSQGQLPGAQGGNRGGAGGGAAAQAGARPTQGQLGGGQAGNRGGGGGAAGTANLGGAGGAGGGADRVGNRSVPTNIGGGGIRGGSGGAFGGASGGGGGSAARTSSSRGAASRGGGGGRR